MRNTAASILAVLVSAVCSTSVLASALADPADASALGAFVDGAVRPLMKNHNSPAGAVAIVKGGRLVLAKGYGFQDLARRIPVDPARSLFRAGSVSKLFTWVAVMQLVEQGKLDLDRDVNGYLWDLKIDKAFDEPITLRHIMTHTAGFEDGRVGYLVVDSVKRMMSLGEAMRQYQPERVTPPGTQASYSNYATALAGLIVENVSGVNYNEYVARNIFDVLGMKHSTFDEPLPERLGADMTNPYLVAQGRYQRGYFELISGFGPAGALSTTATDMARFAQAILNGGELEGRRILKQDTVERMLTRAFAQDDRLVGMGLGFYEKDINGTRVWGHAGAMPFFHSDLVIDRGHDLAFFTSFAAFGGAVVNAAFSQAFYDQYYPAPVAETPLPPEDFASRADRFAGTYLPWRASFSKFEKVRELMSNGLRVVPMPDRTLLLVADTGSKRYVEVARNLFKEQDPGIVYSVAASRPRMVAFQEDAHGDISGLALDGRPYTSSYKAAAYQTARFSRNLVFVSAAIFAAVLFGALGRRVYRRSTESADRPARRVALASSAVNLAVLGFGAAVLPKVLSNEYAEFTLAFRVFMWTPFLVVGAALLMSWQTVRVWRYATLSGWCERVRYAMAMLSCVSMCWFYWYWNLMGPHYFH